MRQPKLFIAFLCAFALSLLSARSARSAENTADLNSIWVNDSVKVTFNSNGGGLAPNSQVYVNGVERSLPGKCQMEKPGYEFMGWSTSSTATTPTWKAGDCSSTGFGFASATSKVAMTFYAVWEVDELTKAAQFLGYGKSTSVPTEAEYPTATLVEKFNYITNMLQNYINH